MMYGILISRKVDNVRFFLKSYVDDAVWTTDRKEALNFSPTDIGLSKANAIVAKIGNCDVYPEDGTY